MAIRNEKHNWTLNGANILSVQSLKTLEQIFAKGDSIIVEHRIYCGGGNPYRLIFDDMDDFTDYLKLKAKPGDNILVWSYEDLCRNNNISIQGKYPDIDGCVPTGGAY